MTRSDLLTSLARRTNKNTTLDTATQNRLLDFLNERQRRILSMPGTQHFRDVVLSLSSVASQADYTFPNLAKVRRITDTDNDRVLYEMSEQDYRLLDPAQNEGVPEAFVWRGRRAVAKQPSNASELFVKSSSAADTTQTAYLEGMTSDGRTWSKSKTLTGTTAVSFDTGITTWTRVDKFYLSATGAGYITLHEDSGAGTELAQISVGKTSTDYFGISLWRTPSASSIAYLVDATRQVSDLAQSNDVPLLPEDFHDLLLLGALMDEYQHMSDSRYAVAAGEYQQRMREFRYWLAETATGRQPMAGLAPPSSLGAWYPAGT